MSTDRTIESLMIRTIAKMDETIRKRDEQIQALRVECRDLARDYARAHSALAERRKSEPRPLAVGDRVRLVRPEEADGVRDFVLAEGDEGTVTAEADEDGDILFRRDGTDAQRYIAAANVERIEDER